jgi:hypothetical protein
MAPRLRITVQDIYFRQNYFNLLKRLNDMAFSLNVEWAWDTTQQPTTNGIPDLLYLN